MVVIRNPIRKDVTTHGYRVMVLMMITPVLGCWLCISVNYHFNFTK